MSAKTVRSKQGKRLWWVWIPAAAVAVLAGVAYALMDWSVSYTLNQIADVSIPTVPEGTVEQAGTKTANSATPSDLSPDTRTDESEPARTPPQSHATTEDTPREESDSSDERAGGAEPELTYSPDITGDKAKIVEEKITAREKMIVAGTVLKHFSPNELKTFAAMAADGISVEEKKAARDLFIQRLSEDEYNRLISIAAKYGLSRGRSYDEIKKEMEAEEGRQR